ncbi:MAG: hypothetical protein ACYDIA_05725 [Candidatus Humimicrobiaceae bacterium]
MKPKLILMFTHNDVTVGNAIEYFDMIKDLPVDFFGFKEIGLPPDKMAELNKKIHDSGFESFLEVVQYEEDKIMPLAKLAVKYSFDYLMGTVYYKSIWNIIENKIKYFPFVGKVYSRPSVLDGTIEEIVADAKRLEETGVDGFDLLAYRYKYPDKVAELIKVLKEAVDIPIVSAGSINSFDRLQETIDSGIWGFTIGGAFIEKKFVAGGNFRDNIISVLKKMGKI